MPVLRALSEAALRRARTAAEVYEGLISSERAAADALRPLRSADHKLMRYVGVALIAAPDPFTGAAGAVLLALSKALYRAGLEDLGRELSKALSEA